MRESERFLKDYWYATRSIGRLMLDLATAKHAYEQSRECLPVTDGFAKVSKQQAHTQSPVERAAIVAVDQFYAEVLSIERRLSRERGTIAHIEKVVSDAGLTTPEADYVRLRYFENRTVEAVAQRLYCSVATCGRLRVSALNKIERVLYKNRPKAAMRAMNEKQKQRA